VFLRALSLAHCCFWYIYIYINDIAYSCPDLNIDLHADDSTLFKSDTELSKIESHLQSNLDYISKWCTYNNKALHPQKTKCMIIGSKQKLRGDKHLTLKVNDNILENVRSQKVLGVYTMVSYYVTSTCQKDPSGTFLVNKPVA